VSEQHIFDAINKMHPFLFRNDNGMGYRKDGKPFKYGLYPGSGDLIGWTIKTIAGRRIAVFTSIEAKTPGVKLSEEQIIWHNNVLAAGGISEIWQEQRSGLYIKITEPI
jgi:hypothetical protein